MKIFLFKVIILFSIEDSITDYYFLYEIIILLSALSKNATIYMMKICDLNTEIQEFWFDCINKYLKKILHHPILLIYV